jgi:hypothetical protein
VIFVAENAGRLSLGGGDVRDVTRTSPLGIRTGVVAATEGVAELGAEEPSAAGSGDPEHPAATIKMHAEVHVARKWRRAYTPALTTRACVRAVRIVRACTG